MDRAAPMTALSVPVWETGGMARGFPYTDLKDFLAALDRAGELRRVTVPVDPTLEISEIVTRTVRAGGPALLFERPTRGEMPVAINLFGTERSGWRWRSASTRSTRSATGSATLVKPELPVGWSGIREGLGKVMQLKSVPPQARSRPRPASRWSTAAPTSTWTGCPACRSGPATAGSSTTSG